MAQDIDSRDGHGVPFASVLMSALHLCDRSSILEFSIVKRVYSLKLINLSCALRGKNFPSHLHQGLNQCNVTQHSLD